MDNDAIHRIEPTVHFLLGGQPAGHVNCIVQLTPGNLLPAPRFAAGAANDHQFPVRMPALQLLPPIQQFVIAFSAANNSKNSEVFFVFIQTQFPFGRSGSQRAENARILRGIDNGNAGGIHSFRGQQIFFRVCADRGPDPWLIPTPDLPCFHPVCQPAAPAPLAKQDGPPPIAGGDDGRSL